MAQVGVAPATVVVQALPHMPQLSASLAVFTHVDPEHSVGVAAGQPDSQA
jgi:hypothetical protein